MPAIAFETTCVLLTPASGAVSSRLHSLLAARDWQTIETADPVHAMTQLCLLERAQTARGAWGLARQQRVALLLIAPEARADLQGLIPAVRKHLPEVALWAYEGGSLTAIHDPYASDDARDTQERALLSPTVMPREKSVQAGPSRAAVATRSAAPPRSAPPPLRMEPPAAAENEHIEAAASAPQHETADENTPDAAITRQEIAMLLDGGFDEVERPR
jgi:hypothetical protein